MMRAGVPREQRCTAQGLWRVVGLVLCVAALNTSLVTPARAQQASTSSALETAEYKELIRKALQEFELSHWAEAKVFFINAHALAPSARTLRGLAMVCYESRQYVEAIDFAQRALESRVQPVTDSMRKALLEYLNQARSFVAHAKVHVAPSDASLRLDGVAATVGVDGIVLLDPGEHELIANAPGYEPLTRRVTVQGGSEIQLDLVLTPEAAPSAGPFAVEPPKPSPPASNERMLPWIVIGASAALVVAGAVALGFAVSDKAKVENSQYPTTWSDVRGAYESAPTLFGVGFVLVGVGVAGAAAGLTWKFWPASPGEHDSSASLHVAPNGLRLSGAF